MGGRGKPKEMHCRAYQRFREEHDGWSNLSVALMMERLGAVDPSELRV